MADVFDLSDPDFTAQMNGLVEEAQQALGQRTDVVRQETKGQSIEPDVQERAAQAYQSLPQMLKPFVAGLEALTRATGENTQILGKLDKVTSGAAESLQQLPGVVAELQAVIEKKDALSRQMFDALHEELRGYKDGFLLESVHRPMIRDLITLYDDISEIHRQMQAALIAESGDGIGPMWDRLKTIEVNIQHNLDFILEVLARLEVTQLPVGSGKLDKRTQRTMAVEITENPDEDLDVIRVVKRGFLWKERVVRPEEVVVKKWKEGFLVALQSCK